MINVYNILKITPTSSNEEIKKVFEREHRVWINRINAPHRERRQEAEWMIKLLEEAEKILFNPEKKAKYDYRLKNEHSSQRSIRKTDFRGNADLVAEGRRLLAEGNVADALFVATKATEEKGDNSEAWALSAQAKFRWGEIEDAIYEYKRAIRLRPNEADYYFDLGAVYESIERWNEAFEYYEKAAKIKPDVSMYRAAMGSIFLRLEQYNDAIQIFEECMYHEPENETYQWYLALAYHYGTISRWWKNPQDSQYYCISKAQLDEAQEIIAKAGRLKYNDPELQAEILKTKDLLSKLRLRKFQGSWGLVVFFSLFWIIPGILWWFANRRPAYKSNKDFYESMTKWGGKPSYVVPLMFQRLAHSLPGWGPLILVLALSPVTLLYSFYDNYFAD